MFHLGQTFEHLLKFLRGINRAVFEDSATREIVKNLIDGVFVGPWRRAGTSRRLLDLLSPSRSRYVGRATGPTTAAS